MDIGLFAYQHLSEFIQKSKNDWIEKFFIQILSDSLNKSLQLLCVTQKSTNKSESIYYKYLQLIL